MVAGILIAVAVVVAAAAGVLDLGDRQSRVPGHVTL